MTLDRPPRPGDIVSLHGRAPEWRVQTVTADQVILEHVDTGEPIHRRAADCRVIEIHPGGPGGDAA